MRMLLFLFPFAFVSRLQLRNISAAGQSDSAWKNLVGEEAGALAQLAEGQARVSGL